MSIASNQERQARRILLKKLGITNKQFIKFNKKARHQGGVYFRYNSYTAQYVKIEP